MVTILHLHLRAPHHLMSKGPRRWPTPELHKGDSGIGHQASGAKRSHLMPHASRPTPESPLCNSYTTWFFLYFFLMSRQYLRLNLIDLGSKHNLRLSVERGSSVARQQLRWEAAVLRGSSIGKQLRCWGGSSFEKQLLCWEAAVYRAAAVLKGSSCVERQQCWEAAVWNLFVWPVGHLI